MFDLALGAQNRSRGRTPPGTRQMSRLRSVLRVSVDDVSTRLLVRPMTVGDAMRVGEWRYRDEWSVYDIESPDVVLDELDLYWAVTDAADDSLVGFVCIGAAARVPGLDADPSLIDVGVGMNPDLVGQGRGSEFGGGALEHLARRHPGRPLRAVIQAWNVRIGPHFRCAWSVVDTRRLGA